MKDKPVKISSKEGINVEKVDVKLYEEPSSKALVGEIGDRRRSMSTNSKPKLLDKKQKSGIKRLFWPALFTFVGGAAIYESYLFIQNLFVFNGLLGSIATVVAGLALVSGAVGLFKGWISRRKLRRRKDKQ